MRQVIKLQNRHVFKNHMDYKVDHVNSWTRITL